MKAEIAGDATKCAAKARDAARKREMQKLNKIFKALPTAHNDLINGLKNQVVFMSLQLQELQQIINEDGVVDIYMNGQQRVIREHPAAKTYNAMIRNYTSLVKQMIDMLPEDKAEAQDELMAFVKKAKK